MIPDPVRFADPRATLRRAAARVPPGRWGVAVSGGADSVACLHLLLLRAANVSDLSLVVIHLDHEMRGAASRADADFVAELARGSGLPLHLRRRSELTLDSRSHASGAQSHAWDAQSHARDRQSHARDDQPHAWDPQSHAWDHQPHAWDPQSHAWDRQPHAWDHESHAWDSRSPAGDSEQPSGYRSSAGPSPSHTANLSARLRRMRLNVYREAVEQHALQGVILAHHADDVAETLLLRLLRGNPASGTLGLAPLRFEQTVGGVRLLRPLLEIRRSRLRRFLERTGRAWREDASNAQDITLRNRLRRLLAGREEVTARLLSLSRAAADAEAALDRLTPVLPESPRLDEIVRLPGPVRRRAARRWLVARGLPEAEAGPRAVERLLAICDTAGPRAANFAAGLRIRRHKGRLEAELRED